jgi:hypothetical protein
MMSGFAGGVVIRTGGVAVPVVDDSMRDVCTELFISFCHDKRSRYNPE